MVKNTKTSQVSIICVSCRLFLVMLPSWTSNRMMHKMQDWFYQLIKSSNLISKNCQNYLIGFWLSHMFCTSGQICHRQTDWHNHTEDAHKFLITMVQHPHHHHHLGWEWPTFIGKLMMHSDRYGLSFKSIQNENHFWSICLWHEFVVNSVLLECFPHGKDLLK